MQETQSTPGTAPESEPTRRSGVRCPLCKRRFAADDRAGTERLFALTESPMARFFSFHDHVGYGEVPPISEAFVSYLDHDRKRGPIDYPALERCVEEFVSQFGSLAGILAAHLLWNPHRATENQPHTLGKSNRMLAVELGLSHPTVETILGHGKRVLTTLAEKHRVFLLPA